ncbi:MAG: O-antigen ligase family protein, partial [Thiobacillus sp.]|nr:O-antigen ligase family protein [Thiobacillus sp.]
NIDGAIRVIKSKEALVLAQVLIGGLFFAAAARGLQVAQWLSPLLLGATLALQHRSVWFAALVGVLTRFMAVRSKQSSTASQLLLVAAIVGVTAIPLVFSEKLSGLTQQIQQSAERALQGRDTTHERLSNWKSLIKLWYQGGAKSIVIGQSFGADSSRYVEEEGGRGVRKITYFAHNLFVQTLYTTGLVGLTALLAAFTYVMRGLYRLTREGVGGMDTQILLVIVVMQMAYYVPYQTDYLQSLLFGVALSYVAMRLPRKAPASVNIPAAVSRA